MMRTRPIGPYRRQSRVLQRHSSILINVFNQRNQRLAQEKSFIRVKLKQETRSARRKVENRLA